MENQFFVDSGALSESALKRKHQLENDPSCRTDIMEYMEGQEQIQSDIREKVMSQVADYDPSRYTAADVRRALQKSNLSVEDLKALLSPAAAPFLEQMAENAQAFRQHRLPVHAALYRELLRELLRLLRLQLLQPHPPHEADAGAGRA